MLVLTKKKETLDFWNILLLMFCCLLFLVLGNAVFHAGIFPIGKNASYFLMGVSPIDKGSIATFSDFLWMVILLSHRDILCVILIAFSCFVKIQKAFVMAIFSYRSFVFGFCGAYIIEQIGTAIAFGRGVVFWLLFFLYHVCFFAMMICFGSATFSITDTKVPLSRKLSYGVIVCGEVALVILLNVIYYFLISKI